MRMRIAASFLMLALGATVLHAHDLFFRLESFFVSPGATVKVHALNGTFSTSENSVTRDRLRDLTVVSPSGRAAADTALWSAAGDTSVFSLRTTSPGTYLVGASLRPREITLEAKDFNKYLADDGVPDVLEARRRNGELEKPATERYSKHIKALIQVGPTRTAGFGAVLGYPAELVPLDNPYVLRRGSTLRVRAMVDGKAVPNQLVVWGGRFPDERRFQQRSVRTNADGVARVQLPSSGQYFVKFISMVPWRGQEKLDYESKWSTLTFAVR